ncbi:MAG: hypothetical protein RIR16_957 [Actinomycetota bacterium]
MTSNESAFRFTSTTTRIVMVTFGVFTSALFWLVVATYPSFFLFNPFVAENPLRAVILTITTLGWLMLAIGPGLLFFLYGAGVWKALRFLPVIALVWPVSLVINHLSLLIQDGKLYTGYLLDYPIFIATDILLPILLIAVWFELRHPKHPLHKHIAS